MTPHLSKSECCTSYFSPNIKHPNHIVCIVVDGLIDGLTGAGARDAIASKNIK